MGMSEINSLAPSRTTRDILKTLSAAEKIFWSDLSVIAKRGIASHVRDTAMSLAMIRALQTSLGEKFVEAPVLAARLLGMSNVAM